MEDKDIMPVITPYLENDLLTFDSHYDHFLLCPTEDNIGEISFYDLPRRGSQSSVAFQDGSVVFLGDSSNSVGSLSSFTSSFTSFDDGIDDEYGCPSPSGLSGVTDARDRSDSDESMPPTKRMRMSPAEDQCIMVEDMPFYTPSQQTFPPSVVPSNPPETASLSDLLNLKAQTLPKMELRVSTPVEALWYVERPFPPFEVDIVSAETSEPLPWIHSRLHGLKVCITLLDGDGNDVSMKMRCAGETPYFPVINGRATIRGVRFTAVSSRYGGGFRFALSLTRFGNTEASTQTELVQVLSYRLFHSPKVAFENLKPDDSISKIKGIGSGYAKRFQAIGICSVSQLSEMNIDSLSEDGIRELLMNLRRDRGAMTLPKLREYIQRARDIVDKCPGRPQAVTTPHTVARCLAACSN